METRKALNYDLYSKKVEKYYTGTSNAWNDIKKFLCSHGFEDRQYSGVVSIKPMTRLQVRKVLSLMNKKYDWLKKCIRRFDMTSIGNELDMSMVFNESPKKIKIVKKEPLDLKALKKEAKEYNKNRVASLGKSKDDLEL